MIVDEILKNCLDEINAITSYQHLLDCLQRSEQSVEITEIKVEELTPEQKTELQTNIKEIIGDEMNHLIKLMSDYSDLTGIEVKGD